MAYSQGVSQPLTKEQRQIIRKVFDDMDKDHNGRLSTFEIKRAAAKTGVILTKRDLESIIREADGDGNGFIEYKEFAKALGPHLLIAEQKNKQFREYFNKFDLDRNGVITRRELKIALRELGQPMNDEEIQQLMDEADTNKDGVISFEEFCECVFE